MAAQRLNKRQLKRELAAVRPYSRSQLAQHQGQQDALHRQMAMGQLQWLRPYLPPDWQRWVQQVLPPQPPDGADAPTLPRLCSSFVLSMDIPLLRRFAAEFPQQPGNLYVHSRSDAQALVFNEAGNCCEARLQQEQVDNWQASTVTSTEYETQLLSTDAIAMHAAWDSFATEMQLPANLSQFSIQVFDAGLQNQRLVCISPITLDWMSPYENIHTQCLWFNGVSRIMDDTKVLHTMGHGRD